jgi:hypothetical protein
MSDDVSVNLTAQELANQLQVEKQPAYQLVTALVAMGLAEAVGTRKELGKKGKGATVYCIEQKAVSKLFKMLQTIYKTPQAEPSVDTAPEPETEPTPDPEPEPDLAPMVSPVESGPRWEGGVDFNTASNTPIIEVVPSEERAQHVFFKVTVEPARAEDWA